MITLERALTFTDKYELDEYLDNSPFNFELYKAFLANKDNDYRWRYTPIDTFNEVYYQCTRINNDPHPESDVYYTYLNDVRDSFGTRYASDMIFAMVNAVFEVMENKPKNVELFLSVLSAHYKDDKSYFQQYKEFALNFIKDHGKLLFDFSYCPVPPTELNFEPSEWEIVTSDFERNIIRKLVNRYSSVEDKLKCIDIIEKAYDDTKTLHDAAKAIIDNLPF